MSRYRKIACALLLAAFLPPAAAAIRLPDIGRRAVTIDGTSFHYRPGMPFEHAPASGGAQECGVDGSTFRVEGSVAPSPPDRDRTITFPGPQGDVTIRLRLRAGLPPSRPGSLAGGRDPRREIRPWPVVSVPPSTPSTPEEDRHAFLDHRTGEVLEISLSSR